MHFLSMNPRLLISAMLLATSTSHALVYPLDLFLPAPNFKDSMSMRFVSEGRTRARIDHVPGISSGTMTSIEVHGKSEAKNGMDSANIHVEWDSRIPAFLRGLFDGASSYRRTIYSTGSAPLTDSSWSTWNGISRTLIRHSSEVKNCSWMDSSVFDDLNRLVFQKGCAEEQIDEDGTLISDVWYSTYQAWFESPTDTLPRGASLRMGNTPTDSILSFGPANRPDSLRGGSMIKLARNALGLVEAIQFPQDTTHFEYDTSNRLIREFSAESETRYLYSWSDPVGIRHKKSPRGEHTQLVSGGLRLNLPTPEHVRVERISMDGKRLALLADKFLPAGRSIVPISVKAGDLVRIESSSSQTILVAPVH
jgi:hypothetical protein